MCLCKENTDPLGQCWPPRASGGGCSDAGFLSSGHLLGAEGSLPPGGCDGLGIGPPQPRSRSVTLPWGVLPRAGEGPVGERAFSFPAARPARPASLWTLGGPVLRGPPALTPAWPRAAEGQLGPTPGGRGPHRTAGLACGALSCQVPWGGRCCPGELALVPVMGGGAPGGLLPLLPTVWGGDCVSSQASSPSPGQRGVTGPPTRVLDPPTEAAVGPDPGGPASLLHRLHTCLQE